MFWNFNAINQLVLNLLRARQVCQREKCSFNLCVYVNSSKISRVRAQAQDWCVIVQIIKTLSWFLERFLAKANQPPPIQCPEQFQDYKQAGTNPTAEVGCIHFILQDETLISS